MNPKIIYIAGFRQHAGKTITSIGLINLLKKYFKPEEIAYIKPVGQELVTLPDGSMIDKDAPVIQKFCKIPDMDMNFVSPVRLGSGFTKRYLQAKDKEKETNTLCNNIIESIDTLKNKKIIIAEGTGHPGVGGIVGLSNADVCSLIGSDIIYLSGGGIGKALDMLEIDLSYFKHKGNKVRGIIFNKLIPEKIDTVKKYITEDLLNEMFPFNGKKLRILGYLPEVENLPKPSMRVLAKRFKKAEIIGDLGSACWEVPAKDICVISLPLAHLKFERYLTARDLVIIGSNSDKRISKLIEYNKHLENTIPENTNCFNKKGLSGIILTCGETEDISKKTRKKLIESRIPTLLVKEETADTEKIVLKAFENTKLQLFDSFKYQEIAGLFENHFNIEALFETFDINV